MVDAHFPFAIALSRRAFPISCVESGKLQFGYFYQVSHVTLSFSLFRFDAKGLRPGE
jgi:hypothetical protein